MDPSMIIGIVAGVGLIVYGIGFGNITAFLSLQGAAIVIGGTFAALVASFPSEALKKVPKQIRIAITGASPDPGLYIDQISDCAKVARKHGLLALEQLSHAQEDEFMRDSMLLIVDALDANKVRAMLETELAYLDERRSEGIMFFERGAAFAPAFGLLGTIIGLILMLSNLGLENIDANQTVTNGMAIALVTTFYGSLLSNLFFTPIASKLQATHDREMLCKRIILEGILAIQAGEYPRFIREKLIAFLPQKERIALQTADREADDGEENKSERKKGLFKRHGKKAEKPTD